MIKTKRDETEKRRVISKILLLIYYEWGKEISEDLVNYWLENLRGRHVPSCELAATLLIQIKTYGEPKLADFIDVYKTKTKGTTFEYYAEQDAEKRAKKLAMESQPGALKSIPYQNNIPLPDVDYLDSDPCW